MRRISVFGVGIAVTLLSFSIIVAPAHATYSSVWNMYASPFVVKKTDSSTLVVEGTVYGSRGDYLVNVDFFESDKGQGSSDDYVGKCSKSVKVTIASASYKCSIKFTPGSFSSESADRTWTTYYAIVTGWKDGNESFKTSSYSTSVNCRDCK